VKFFNNNHANNATRWPGDSSFLMLKISAKLKRGQPQQGAKCRWVRLDVGGVTANWRLSTWTVVNFVRSQVYHTERPPVCFQHVRHDAARRTNLSATVCDTVLHNVTLWLCDLVPEWSLMIAIDHCCASSSCNLLNCWNGVMADC